MLLVEVEGTYALFQGKERLIDFCAVNLGLLVGVHGVSTAFASRQIDETNLAVKSAVVF